MARFRSLRWRLTFLYLGLLAVLLLAGGIAQYFAAREVLFRSNADVLVSEYNAVFTAFKRQNASRPATVVRAGTWPSVRPAAPAISTMPRTRSAKSG